MGLEIIFSQVHNINRDTHTVEERSIANEDLREYVRLLMKDIIENKNYKHYKPIRETTEINVVVKKYIENEKVDDETKTNIAEKYLEAEVTAQELVKKLGVEIKRGYLVEALMKDEEKYYYIISKSEIDSYLDDETTKRRTGLPYKDKTLKSALYIYNAEKERESILISDKSNSEYWVKQFLEVEQENKDDVSTTKIFSMIDAVIKRETIGSSDKGARSRVDYYNLRNYLIMYFKQPRQFVYDEMMAYIFEEYVPEHPQVVNMTRLKAAVYNKVKSSKYDTTFNIVPSVITAKVKTVFKANSCVDVQVKSGAENMRDLIESFVKDETAYLQIKVEDEDTFKSFYHGKREV